MMTRLLLFTLPLLLIPGAAAQQGGVQASLVLLGPVDVWLTWPHETASAEIASLRSDYIASLDTLRASLPSPTTVATGSYVAPGAETTYGADPMAFLEDAGVDVVLPSAHDLLRGSYHLNGVGRMSPAPVLASDVDLRGLAGRETQFIARTVPLLVEGQPIAQVVSVADRPALDLVPQLTMDVTAEGERLTAALASAEPLPAVALTHDASVECPALTLHVPALEPQQAAVYRLGAFAPGAAPEPEIVDLVAPDSPALLRPVTPQVVVGPRIDSTNLRECTSGRVAFEQFGEVQRLAADLGIEDAGPDGSLYSYDLIQEGQTTHTLFVVTASGPTIWPMGICLILDNAAGPIGLAEPAAASFDLAWTSEPRIEGRPTRLPELIQGLIEQQGLLLPEVPPFTIRGAEREYAAVRAMLAAADEFRRSLSELP